MASKKKAAVVEVEPVIDYDVVIEQDGGAYTGRGASFVSEFDQRKFFIQDTARQILLSISARRSNGQPVRGDERAAVASATELADLLGIE